MLLRRFEREKGRDRGRGREGGAHFRRVSGILKGVEKPHEAHLLKKYLEKQRQAEANSNQKASFSRQPHLISKDHDIFKTIKAEGDDTFVQIVEEKRLDSEVNVAFEDHASEVGLCSETDVLNSPKESLSGSLKGLEKSFQDDFSSMPSLDNKDYSPNITSLSLADAAPITQYDRADQDIVRRVMQSQSSKSLLEELFPEEITKNQSIPNVQKAGAARSEPRKIPLPSLDKLHDTSATKQSRVRPRIVSSTSKESNQPVPVLLILENALPNLSDADFDRISPKGKHIAEWKSMFRPVAIIPARTSLNIECTGKYYLVFHSISHAKAWRTRLKLLHKISQVNTPVSLIAPLVPRKGFSTEGEDIGETLREYSVFSSGVEPIIRLCDDPEMNHHLKDDMRMVLARLQQGGSKFLPGRSVLLWIEGWSLATVEIIKKMIVVDGRKRHMQWGDMACENIIEDYHKHVPLLREKDVDPTSTVSQKLNRWMITLQDEAEARRFVRAWHMQPFPAWPMYRQGDQNEPWPLIKAELLW